MMQSIVAGMIQWWALQDGALQEKIEALRVPDVAWRRIPWRTCLIDALRESRERKRPVVAWIFIDRPVDDERC